MNVASTNLEGRLIAARLGTLLLLTGAFLAYVNTRKLIAAADGRQGLQLRLESEAPVLAPPR